MWAPDVEQIFHGNTDYVSTIKFDQDTQNRTALPE